MTHRLLFGVLLALGLVAGAQGRTFRATVTHVTDGDTIWVRPASGAAPLAIRLQGLDAPEICQVFGEASRDALARRLLKRQVKVVAKAQDSYDRALGKVTLDGADVGAWLVERGYAWSDRFRTNTGPYTDEEKQARRARRGLWKADGPEEPREFRKRHGSCYGNRQEPEPEAEPEAR